MSEHEEVTKLLKELIELVKAIPKTENHYHYHYANPPVTIEPQSGFPYTLSYTCTDTTGANLR